MDLVNKYPREQLPEALTGYVGNREGYDYHHHAEVGSVNAAFVGDEVTDRFCVLGDVEEHVAKLQELADAGRRPVQHLPDERRRGGAARRVRSDHPALRLTVSPLRQQRQQHRQPQGDQAEQAKRASTALAGLI